MAFQFHLPDIGEGVIEGEIVSWKVSLGQKIDLDQPMVEVQTDKATVEIPAPRAGTISKINFTEGEICPVGDVLVEIDEDGTASTGTQVSVPATAVSSGAPAPAAKPEVIDLTQPTGTRPLATPATRRLARQLGVELTSVRGTGKRGRITSEDVRAFSSTGTTPVDTTPPEICAPVATPEPPTPSSVQTTALSRTAESLLEERIPFRGVRKAIADNMVRSKFTATHFTYVEDVDMTALVEFRNQAKTKAAEQGIKLTYLPFITKAVVAGLKKWPSLNASLDEGTQEIIRKKYYHLGIAAQGPQGLVVTVVRDADRRSIFNIASEIRRLADAVQDGTIKRDEMVGSTFTISSLGKLGGILATPIINFPEVGIIGVHKMEQRPVVRDGEVVVRYMLNLSISLDHRLVDGWDGAMFLQDVKRLLEDPTTLFMEMG